MTHKIFVVGAGGLASEVFSVLKMQHSQNESQIETYFVVEHGVAAPHTVFGRPVLVGLDEIPTTERSEIYVAIGSIVARDRIVTALQLRGHNLFPNLVHPDFRMGLNINIGEGVIALGPGIMTSNCSIGAFSIVNPLCSISHDCKIGSFVNLGPGVLLAGGVTIDDRVDIGVGGKVAPRKYIGQGAVLGAGAVAIRDIPSGATAVGVPTKLIKKEI
ncbi:hypothetical protein [Methylobacterium sp. Gmos1]